MVRLTSNISLDANLEIYTNRTIRPPRKIKKRIYENQFNLDDTQIIRHKIRVWAKIIAISPIGCDVFIKIVLARIEVAKNNLISSGFILIKNSGFGSYRWELSFLKFL